MKTRAERRNNAKKELKHRLKLCKAIRECNDDTDEYIKHKTDVPHSLGSNWWNAFEAKSMRNKQERLKEKNNLKREIENSEE